MKRLITVLVVGLMLTGLSYAADKKDSGFYLRGDLGYSWGEAELTHHDGDIDAVDENVDNSIYDDLKDKSNATAVSVGVGYQINEYLRVDLTYTERKGMEIKDRDELTALEEYAGEELGYSEFSADIDSKAIMLNAYIQKKFNRVIPFFGVGVGYAENKVENFKYENFGDGVGSEVVGHGELQDGKKSSFAWQAMFGAGFELTESVILEFSYTYANLGDIKSDAGLVSNNLQAGADLEGTKGDLIVQDAKVGLRYMF